MIHLYFLSFPFIRGRLAKSIFQPGKIKNKVCGPLVDNLS